MDMHHLISVYLSLLPVMGWFWLAGWFLVMGVEMTVLSLCF